MPKVSVIVPNYNHARFLEQRLESIFNQTYQDFEVIFLDDASSDNSLDVFRKFADEPRVTTVLNEKNSGSPFKQWNKGISLAQGEYIWIAESDDYAHPGLLEKLVDVLDDNPNVGVAYCQSWIVNENNEKICLSSNWIGKSDKQRWDHSFINSGVDECKKYLSFENTIHNASAVVFRTKIGHRLVIADETMKLCGDWCFWIDKLIPSALAYIHEPLNYFRHHSQTVRSNSQSKLILEYYKLIKHVFEHIHFSSEEVDRILDFAISKWFKLIHKNVGNLSLGDNIRILHNALVVDQYFFLRFIRSIYPLLVRENPKIGHFNTLLINTKNNLF